MIFCWGMILCGDLAGVNGEGVCTFHIKRFQIHLKRSRSEMYLYMLGYEASFISDPYGGK